jgi:hypothetical protein
MSFQYRTGIKEEHIEPRLDIEPEASHSTEVVRGIWDVTKIVPEL